MTPNRRARGIVTDIGPSYLTLDRERVTEALGAHGNNDPGVAHALHAITGGWPALVHLGAEMLGRHPVESSQLAEALATPGTTPHRYIADTLSRFAVWIGGRPVPIGAWRSRKARDLLRVLVARRGRAIARDELSELLWPGEPVDRVAHRLSVALSTVRIVLDPQRRAGPDYFIAGDTAALALNKERLTIDAETFADYARYGLDSVRAQRWRDARSALEAADRLYVGDFLDDEPYDDHAAATREHFACSAPTRTTKRRTAN